MLFRSQSLISLDISGNQNYTWQMMTMISTANPELLSLDIHDCINIDLNRSMKEIENLSCLQCMKLGPSNKPIDVNEFLQSMFFHTETLTTLQLNRMPEFSDEELSEILVECPNMTDLSLTEMRFSTLSIEVHFLLIYICNFHVWSHLLLIYICKFHWNRMRISRQ